MALEVWLPGACMLDPDLVEFLRRLLVAPGSPCLAFFMARVAEVVRTSLDLPVVQRHGMLVGVYTGRIGGQGRARNAGRSGEGEFDEAL